LMVSKNAAFYRVPVSVDRARVIRVE